MLDVEKINTNEWTHVSAHIEKYAGDTNYRILSEMFHKAKEMQLKMKWKKVKGVQYKQFSIGNVRIISKSMADFEWYLIHFFFKSNRMIYSKC